jgi:manganese oxidase
MAADTGAGVNGASWTAILFLLALAAPPASAQAPLPPDSAVQVLLQQLVTSHGVRGVVVGLLGEDGTRRVLAHGDPGAGARPLDGESVFEIGSMTKVYAGILLADMVERGEVELADALADLLPPHVRVPARDGRPMTLLDLTTHFSGLPAMPTNLEPADPRNPFADYTTGRMYEFISSYELPRDPGEAFEYSNVGMALLGHALALRSGAPTYEALVTERILQPLGMTRTAVVFTPWMQDHLVRGHDRAGDPVANWDMIETAGMGGLRSTMHDMLAFAAANLSAADPSSEGPGLAAAMRASHRGLRQTGEDVTHPGIPTAFQLGRVGFNWFISRPGERRITWTMGLSGGYSSFLGLDLEAGRAVVVLTNTGLNSVDHLGFHLLDPTVPLPGPRESGPVEWDRDRAVVLPRPTLRLHNPSPVAERVPLGPAAHGEIAGYEDNWEPAGRLEDGRVRVSLEARAAGWRPWGEDGPTIRAHVFAVEGAGAKVPGPLLRVTAGTPMHVTIRNSLGDTLLVRGLLDRGRDLPPGVSPGASLVTLPFVGDSLVVAPGESGEVRFTPTVPGSYFYFGRTMEPGWSSTPGPVPLGGWPEAVSFYGENAPDRALVGVLVVDAPGEVPVPEERIFLISHWADRNVPGTWAPSARFLINGRSWPHTERLVYAQGDTVRWRVINQSGGFHPMHLHGFYFHVDAWAGQDGGSPLAPGERPLVVTWPLPPTTAMRLSWVAHEPGNWIFHCHLMRHMSWMQHPEFGSDGVAHQYGLGDGVDLMGGLVLGITVEPGEGWTQATDVPRRQLRLHIGKRDGVFDGEPGYGFVLQEGPEPPAPDSVRFPGSPIVLTRGEPAEIVVKNHTDVPLGVHWHRLEVESWADGVPGWSGMPGSVVPAIPPGDSFAVRMTPPRTGTFMYHVHSEPGHQLAQGLYGPFLVLEPGESWNTDTDRLFLLASLGAGENPPPAMNGELEPGPMEFRTDTTYRLRFMHISPDDNKSIQLFGPDGPAQWQFIARDGADLPSPRVQVRPADVPLFDVGSTFDVLWTPGRPGDLTLRFVTTFNAGLTVFPGDGPPPHTMDIPVRIW